MTGPEYPDWRETGSQREYHDLAAIGARDLAISPAYLDALRDTVYARVSVRERQRIGSEMGDFARELAAAGRPSAAAMVEEMWTRLVRRLDR